jgi:hypothetical protein
MKQETASPLINLINLPKEQFIILIFHQPLVIWNQIKSLQGEDSASELKIFL